MQFSISILFIILFISIFPFFSSSDEGFLSCPSLDELEDNKGFPLVTPLNSSVFHVSWKALWSTLNWKECFSNVRLIVSYSSFEKEVQEISIDGNFEAFVNTQPCVLQSFVIKAIYNPSNEIIKSHGISRSYQTYETPQLSLQEFDLSPYLTYGPFPFVTLEAPMTDLLNNFHDSCVRIHSTELFIQNKDHDKEWRSLGVKDVSSHLLYEFPLDDKDLCLSYELQVDLIGKTDKTTMYLGKISPRSKNHDMLKSLIGEKGTELPIFLDAPQQLKVNSFTMNSAIVSFSNQDQCMTQNILEFLNQRLILEPENHMVKISNLPSCQIIEGSIRSIIGPIDGFHLSSTIKSFKIVTLPNYSYFSVSSLSLRISLTWVRLSWLISEWPCLKAKDFKIHLYNSEIKEKSGEIFMKDSEYISVLTNLTTCTHYEVNIMVLSDKDDIEWKKNISFRTDILKMPLEEIQIVNKTETSLKLTWKKDICAIGYIILHSLYIGSGGNETSVKESSLETDDEDYDSGSGSEEEEDEIEEDKIGRRGVTVFQPRVTLKQLKPCKNYKITIQSFYGESQFGNKDSDYGEHNIIIGSTNCELDSKANSWSENTSTHTNEEKNNDEEEYYFRWKEYKNEISSTLVPDESTEYSESETDFDSYIQETSEEEKLRKITNVGTLDSGIEDWSNRETTSRDMTTFASSTYFDELESTDLNYLTTHSFMQVSEQDTTIGKEEKLQDARNKLEENSFTTSLMDSTTIQQKEMESNYEESSFTTSLMDSTTVQREEMESVYEESSFTTSLMNSTTILQEEIESDYEESSFTTSLMDSTPINIEAINTIIDNESMIDSFSLTQEVFTKMNMDSTTMNQEPINTVSKESFVTTMMDSSTIIPETNNTSNKDSVLVFMENSTTILHEEVNKESSTRFMEYSTTNLQESIRLESSSRFLVDSTTLMQEVLNTDAITTTTTTLIKDEDSTSKLNELDIYSQTTETGEYSTLLSELLHGVPVSESEDLYTEYEDEEEDVFVSSTVLPTLIVQVPQSPVTNLSFEQIMINDSLVLYIHWGQSLKTTTVLSVQGDKIGKFETFSKGKNFTAEVSLSTCSVYTIELKLENDTLLQRLELLTPYENGKTFTPNDFKITTFENYSTVANWELDESFECISHYLFQIDNLTVVTTESFIVLSELLPLEHCQNYSVSLKAHNSTSEGFTTSFTYVEKRRSHRLEPLTSLISSISENSAVISLSSFDFSCSPIELVFENKSYFIPGFQDYSLESLNACTTYNVSLLNQAHEYLVTNFTTLRNKNEFKPLTPTDVIWTKFINGYKVHWPSRCSSDYKIEWGLINQSIKSESESEVNSVLLTPLLSCRKYEYKIFVEKFLLIQSTFDTDLNDDFKLELEAFEYSRNSESIHLKWTHVHSCITEYRIYLEEEGQEIERVSLNISAPSSLESLQTFIVFPQTCQNIKLKVYPIFSKYINYIYTTLALPFVQEIKKEEPHISGLIISNLTANSADVEWTSNLCSRNYTVSFKDVLLNVNTSKATLESLTPCSKYTARVAFDSSIENNKLYSDINFTTKHETFIPVKALASFHEIVIDLESPYVDCVTAYVGKLSSHKTLYIRPSQKQFTFTFTELTSNTFYDYEIKGLNEHEDIIYFSSGRLQTMRRINHAFLFVKSIEESSLTLELNSSIYDEFKNPQFSISLMCFSDNKLILSQISKNTKTVILDKLEPNSQISCSSNLTFMEESIRMRVIDVRTLDQVPKAPIYLRASNVTSHEVSLEWKTPSNFNGIIMEHRIKISRLCDSKSECGKDCMEAKEMEFVSTNKTNAFSITSLESGTSYQIQIADKTSNPKLGKWSQELIITTRPGAPIYPPKILQTFTTSKDSVILDFEYPCPLTGETIFQVHVEKQGGLIKKQTHRRIFSKQVKARSFEVSGFEGGETYELFLEARVLNCSNCTSRSPSVVLSIKCRHRCKDGTCVHKHRNVTCDYIKDCFDGSDEMNCFCESPDKFLCSNGFCLRASQRCDGTPDCGDRSDEINCKHCSAHQFSCRSNGKCIHKKQTCDRHKDCPDGSDEFGCAYWKMSCWADQFRCLDKTCINVRKQCDGKWDCSFGEDERNCKFAHCKFTEFTCQSDHTCLPTHKYCNGIRDCSDGSDETFGCECHKDGKFACHDGLQCTERLRVCDGVTDCRDESDEFQCYSSSEKKYLNISSLSTSSEKETLSSTSTSNLIRSPVIDLTTPSYNSFSQNPNILPVTPEFSEYDDLEVGNLVMESKFNLKVYPKSQTVPFGGDAVIQCRDEGPLRANVIWRKGNQRYLRKDKRFNVKKGRLEIHKIRRRDRGYYFCVPENAEETNGISTFIEVTFRS